MQRLAENPIDVQTAAGNHCVDIDPMDAGCAWAVAGLNRYAGERERSFRTKRLIRLAEIVETDARLGECGDPAPHFRIGRKITEKAEADTVVRDGTELFLHG